MQFCKLFLILLTLISVLHNASIHTHKDETCDLNPNHTSFFIACLLHTTAEESTEQRREYNIRNFNETITSVSKSYNAALVHLQD